MNLFETYSRLDQAETLHSARLLLLLDAFAGRNGEGAIDGLTKIAKLDFLLRYPVALERALREKDLDESLARVTDHERRSVESSMIRYKYGPWDPRHRAMLNVLAARGLAKITVEGRTIRMGLTPLGQEMAAQLKATPEYDVIAQRAKVLAQKFDMGGTNLMKFVYRAFPELETMRHGEEIRL